MTPQEFRKWLDDTGLTQRAAAEELGIASSTIVRYLQGQLVIPRSIALACAALQYLKVLPDYIGPLRSEATQASKEKSP